VITLPVYVADMLALRASALAAHWQERARAATPRRPERGEGGDAAGRSAVPATARVTAYADEATAAPALVRALATSLRKDARPVGEVMRAGWHAGADAHAAGLSLRHVVRDADLLLAVLLAEMERVLESPPDDLQGTPADAIALARRLHQTAGGYQQAAVSGFVHAFLGALRERYRLLRHDMRNPLGTIQGALSLMEDESVPMEQRHAPAVRQMVARNAGSLDRLIAAGLDDTAAASLLATAQDVEVRDVVLAARREARESARAAGCDISVDLPAGWHARVDAAALELTLSALVLAAVAEAEAGDMVHVGVGEVPSAETMAGAVAGAPGTQLALRLVVHRAGGASSDAAAEQALPRPAALAAVAPDGGDGGDAGAPDVAAASEPEGGEAVAASAPRQLWDVQGVALAVSILADQGGRLTAEGLSLADPDVSAPQVLAATPALVLTLPLRPAPTDPRRPRRRVADAYAPDVRDPQAHGAARDEVRAETVVDAAAAREGIRRN
jgi:signal transduction histidine kinase